MLWNFLGWSETTPNLLLYHPVPSFFHQFHSNHITWPYKFMIDSPFSHTPSAFHPHRPSLIHQRPEAIAALQFLWRSAANAQQRSSSCQQRPVQSLGRWSDRSSKNANRSGNKIAHRNIGHTLRCKRPNKTNIFLAQVPEIQPRPTSPPTFSGHPPRSGDHCWPTAARHVWTALPGPGDPTPRCGTWHWWVSRTWWPSEAHTWWETKDANYDVSHVLDVVFDQDFLAAWEIRSDSQCFAEQLPNFQQQFLQLFSKKLGIWT